MTAQPLTITEINQAIGKISGIIVLPVGPIFGNILINIDVFSFSAYCDAMLIVIKEFSQSREAILRFERSSEAKYIQYLLAAIK